MKTFFILLAPILATASLLAQAPVPHGVLTAATTTSGAEPWLYVRWQPTDQKLPFGTPFAVYLKNGAANDNVPLQSKGVSLLAEEQALAGLQLSRAQRLGTDLAALERDVSAYASAVADGHAAEESAPVDNAPVALKLARLIHQARSGDERTASALRQMAMAHPGIALAIGEAWAGPISAAPGAPVTVELRSWDPVTCQEKGIAGRITVLAGQPDILLAPGAPVQVPDSSATGDRVVKLRWATSPDLRRQTPLTIGFAVYRVQPAAAESRDWHVTPPNAADLRALTISSPAEAKRLNDGPIRIGKVFDAFSVSNFFGTIGDALTRYVTDDNNRYVGVTDTFFPDGTRHYYFAVAVDLLGREGTVSPAGEGTACVRVSPQVPAEFALLNESLTANGVACQCFTLRWKANLAQGDDDTDSYQIFRGSQVDTPNVQLADLTTLPPPIATLPHAPDEDGYMTWRDESLPQGIAGRTYWYVVRAVHASPCPPDNYSALSPQVYGTLNTAEAPPAPAAAQAFQCPLAGIMMNSTAAPPVFENLAEAEQDDATRTVRLVITRTDPGISWVETKWSWQDYAETEFTRVDFPDDSNELTAEFTVAAYPHVDSPVYLRIKAGSAAGAESALVGVNFGRPGDVVGWTKDKVRVLHGKAAAPAMGEITTANADHVAMFYLNTAPTELTPVPAGGKCFSAPISGLAHKPFVIQVNRGGWTTLTGAEISSGKLFFCDPQASETLASYRAIPITIGVTRCLHFADGADGRIIPIMLRLELPPDFGEYRIYRKVDDGALSLLAQGDGQRLPENAAEVIRQDDGIPATACVLRYYGQTFDKQGQGSPLVPLGDPILLGRRDVATPTLRAPSPRGTSAAPVVRLEWFCPPEGIERFRLTLNPLKITGAPASNRNMPATLFQIDPPKKTFLHARRRIGQAATFRAKTLTGLTGLIGPDQPLGEGPVFSMELPVEVARRYEITMEAISLAGVASGKSKAFTFAWTPPPPPPVIGQEPTVAWPERSLPDSGFWHPLVRAELTKNLIPGPAIFERWDIVAPGAFEDYPVGVRIAAVRGTGDPDIVIGEPDETDASRSIAAIYSSNFTSLLRGDDANPLTYLLGRTETSELISAGSPVSPRVDVEAANRLTMKLAVGNLPQGDILLPAVLYRRQVASPRYPSVSGATIQVSPMIHKIASETDDGLFLRDPYIGAIKRESAANLLFETSTFSLDLFLLDTQPVVKGARYHYTLVRFSPVDGEMIESIDAGEVLIPEIIN